jgi:uncharacterized repeat protein (TIGR01451 family)
VQPVADLSLTKSDAPDPVLAGELLTYTLTAHNSGPSSATAVELTDNLPTGAAFDSATASQGSCSQAAGVVTCALGTLADEAGAEVEVKVRPLDAGTNTNTASVSSGVQDPNTANNSASADTTVESAADLSLTKSDSPDPVMEGQQLTYTLTVDNAGPHSASAVQLTDTLPAGVTFDSATASQGTCSETAGTVECALGTIADDASASVEIDVTPQAPGTLTNEASVTSDVADPDTADRSATAETTVDPVADLALTKSDAPDPVLAGEQLTYTLTVSNSGPRSATGVQLTDTLPASVTFDSATPSQGTCSQDAGVVTCALDTITNGGGASVEITVTPQEGGTITNEASVVSDQRDPTPADNSASTETTVDPSADLELTKTDSPDPVLAGELLTYTLDIHNAGPSSAAAVQMIDTLPAGVTFDSATPTQGSCDELAGSVECALGTIANGTTATVTIEVRPQTPGTITNQAGVVSLALDSDTADNNATIETTVEAAADLSLTKSDDPDPVRVGDLLTYTLSVDNAGPQEATAVTLSDTLPAGVTFESAVPSQGTCAEAAGTVDCELGTIASGADATVEIKVTPQADGSLTNEASVDSAVADPDSADRSASEQTTVAPVADLALSKSDSPDPVLVDELLTYSLTVHNAGPSSAANVSVTDDLDADVTFDSATASQGTCSEDAGAVTCALGTIADEGNATIEIKVRPQAAGTITNQANVTSDAHDPTPADNSANAETTVDRVANLSLTKTDSPDPAVTNETVTYTITAHNAGPSGATSVSVTDNLPAGVIFDSATASQGSCSQAAGVVSCALGTLGNGADATATVKIRPQSAGSITNAASVSSTAVDPDTNDNAASAGTQVNQTAGFARPRGATPLRVPLVVAYAACTSSNEIHGPPLASASCKPPAQSSSFLTVGTPDANGPAANMVGVVKFDVKLNTAPTANDVLIAANITDVRCATGVSACGATNLAGGADYTGQLQASYALRITDRFSSTGTVSATVSDTAFPATVPCTQSASTAIGATCVVNTSANALMPGSIQTGSRAIWELGQVRLLDGGTDGAAATLPNSVFATQGLFIP